MSFQSRLRKEFMKFSLKLIFVVLSLFISVTVLINLVNRNINKSENISFVDNSFQNLLDKIHLQIASHNANTYYIDTIKEKRIDRRLISETNYSFSRKMNVRYDYSIYDTNLTPVYQESYHLVPRYTIYLSIILDRIKTDSPIKFILYPSLKGITASLIYYDGLYDSGKLIGFEIYSIDINDLAYTLFPNNGDYVITDRFDNIIATNNHKVLEQNPSFKDSKNYQLESINYRVTTLRKDYYTIYHLERRVRISTYYLILFTALILVLVLVIAFSNQSVIRLAEMSTKSFKSIIADTNRVSTGELTHKINENLDEDFRNLAVNINEMLDHLNTEIKLNKELSEANLVFEKRKLDAQFNPHFLYNSLETIRYSMQFDLKGAEKYILDLNSILRYSISNEINYSTIEDDFRYLDKFLKLHKYRLGKKLTYSIDLSDDLKNIEVPKLAIQPLVSNSIKYGFTDSLTLKIDIYAGKRESCNFIQVRDSGTSITDKIIDECNRIGEYKMNPTNHIGVHNVLRRFNFLYPDAELKVYKDENGTCFDILFNKNGNIDV